MKNKKKQQDSFPSPYWQRKLLPAIILLASMLIAMVLLIQELLNKPN